MMRKKVVLFLLGCVAFSLFVLHWSPVVFAVDDAVKPSFADDFSESVLNPKIDSITSKIEEKQGGVILESKKFPLEHYEGVSTADPTWDPVLSVLMSVGNGLFWCAKFIYQAFDYGINLFSSQEILTNWIDKIQEMSSDIWSKLQDSMMSFVIAILGIVLVIQFFLQMNTMKALNTFIVFCVVFILGSFFMTNGALFIKKANETSNGFQSSILSVGTTLTGDSKEIDAADTNAGVTAIIRNTYFNIAVMRPYLLMNYGTTDIDALTETDPKRIDNLLAVKRNSKSEVELKEAIKEDVETYENDYMDKTGKGVYVKFGMGIGSILMVVGLGIPLLILSFANILIQILILGIVLILAFSFFISLIPAMRNSWIKPLTTILGLILSKSFIVIFLFFVFLLIAIVDSMVPPTAGSGAGYVVNSVILIALMWLILLKHGMIVSMMTGGRVQMNTSEGVQRFAKNRASNARHRSLKNALNKRETKDDDPKDDEEDNEKDTSKRRNRKASRTSTRKQNPSQGRGTPNPTSGKSNQDLAPSRHRMDPKGEGDSQARTETRDRPPGSEGSDPSKQDPPDKPMRREGEVKNPLSAQRERPEGESEMKKEGSSPHRGNAPRNQENTSSEFRERMNGLPEEKEALPESTHRGDARPSVPLAKEPKESEHRRPTSESEKTVTPEAPQEPQKESKFKTSVHPRKQEKSDDERPKRPQVDRPERLPSRGDSE